MARRTAAPLDLRIPSDIRHIEDAVAQVLVALAPLPLPRQHLALNIPVALTEALSNAILRGNGDDPGKTVLIRVRPQPDRVVIEVADEGLGFDLDACTGDATAPDALEREDGRGLFLMRRLMDGVERFTDGGNVVRLTLRIA
ncbi:MAG: ATP-binding protein [Gemmatimonadaceae bacterium]|nr:ATP-binding protein [Gemmatimonadaceae bacterium]